MVNGTIKFYNIKKRFGFVAGEDGKDYFIHKTGIEPGNFIKEGDKVVFEIQDSEKGPVAVKLKLISKEE